VAVFADTVGSNVARPPKAIPIAMCVPVSRANSSFVK
jgi:hypothetical protein